MRLVYFGKLLVDHLEVRDFIRVGNDQIVHNVHLVYTQCSQNETSKTSSSSRSNSSSPVCIATFLIKFNFLFKS